MTDEIIKLGLVSDDDAQVRLAAFLALAQSPKTPQQRISACARIWSVWMDPNSIKDRWLLDVATVAAAEDDFAFLQSLKSIGAKLPPEALEMVAIVARHGAHRDLEGV
jgi:hypothetical protein